MQDCFGLLLFGGGWIDCGGGGGDGDDGISISSCNRRFIILLYVESDRPEAIFGFGSTADRTNDGNVSF